MLLVKTMIAPESIEYLVSGSTIDLNTVKGLAPKVLAASSMSKVMRSIAADIDRTKYGKVMAKWAKTSSINSGTPVPCQKNFNDSPRAMDGTIIGMLSKVSSMVEGHLPNVFRAISIAIGIPMMIPKIVTVTAKP